MGNSPLVNYTKISPNRTSPRNHAIDTITIHCVVGQCSVETLGSIFAPTTRQASSNYGVGYDGRIGMYCEEKDRSWCTSSGANDHRAITIEVASDTYHPYAVNEEAYAALIDLCVDICKRNNIKKVLWEADKALIGQPDKQNLTVHRWFANKACPGDFLYNRHADLVAKINARLGATAAPEEKPARDTTPAKVLYRVQIGAFAVKSNATAFEAKVKAAGFDTYLVKIAGFYKVQVGAFGVKANADAMLEKLTKAGYAGAFITSAAGGTASPEAALQEIRAGSKVRLKKGATTYDGKSLASFVYEREHIVSEVADKRAVITYGGVVVAAVYVGDLIAV